MYNRHFRQRHQWALYTSSNILSPPVNMISDSFFNPRYDAEKLPSLSSHHLLAIWHAHAIGMCVSIKILLLEVATKALALGYWTVFVL